MNIHLKNYLLALSLLIYVFGISHVCSCRSDYNKNGTRCYKYFTTYVSWEQANSICTNDNASLIKMDEVNVFKLVQSILTADKRSDIWVGARRKPNSKIVQWLDGHNVSRFWNSHQYNPYERTCVEAQYFNFSASLNDFQCEQKLSFVCEGECRSDYTRNGTICYKYFADAVSWEEAARQCKGDNSTLIKVDKRETLSLLESILIKNFVSSIWVGAKVKSNSREFQWINGANVSQFWNTGEPNNDGGVEDCVVFVIDTPGFLSVQFCTDPNPFVCEAQDTSAYLTTQGVTSQGTPRDKSELVTKTSAQLTTPGVTSQGRPQDKSDTTLLAVKIAVPLVGIGLLSGALTAVVCIRLMRRKRQTPAYDDLAPAANPAASDHNYYLTPIDNESHDYATVK